MERIGIIGCGGHARSAADIIMDNFPLCEISFYDENAAAGELILNKSGKKGFPVYPLSALEISDIPLFIAIGDNERREEYAEKYGLYGNIASVISKRAYISPFSETGRGCFVGDGAHIGPEASVGEFSIINTSAVVEHEVLIGAFSHISVNAAVCGRCRIGRNVFIGAGAVIRDNITVCDNVTIGAGAAVVKDITSSGIYAGVPAGRLS